MKLLNLISIFVLTLFFASCENESVSADPISQTEERQEAQAQKGNLNACFPAFARRFDFRIRIKNGKGETRSFFIKSENVTRSAYVLNVDFPITEELLKLPFFRSGIRTYTFISVNEVPRNTRADVAHIVGEGEDSIFSVSGPRRVKKGQKIMQGFRISEREREMGISSLGLSLRIDLKRCSRD